MHAFWLTYDMKFLVEDHKCRKRGACIIFMFGQRILQTVLATCVRLHPCMHAFWLNCTYDMKFLVEDHQIAA